jgi:hypothetical protein
MANRWHPMPDILVTFIRDGCIISPTKVNITMENALKEFPGLFRKKVNSNLFDMENVSSDCFDTSEFTNTGLHKSTFNNNIVKNCFTDL